MSFAARYDGGCAACLERIYVGDQVAYGADDKLVHVDCEVHAPAAEVIQPTCPRCFMVRSVNGACGCEDD